MRKESWRCPGWGALAVVWAMTGCVSSARVPANAAPRLLRTTHVTLYDCGLAQVEQQTEVAGAERFAIATSAAQLDDLAATLTVAADRSVGVTGVEYESTVNMAQAAAASGFARSMISDEGFARPSDFAGYIRALAGVDVTVERRDRSAARGTVIDCVARQGPAVPENTEDREPPAHQGRVVEPERVLLLAGVDGALTAIPLEDIVSLTPTAEREADALRAFAATLGRTEGFADTAVHLRTTPDSRGRLAVGFVRQAPLWRMLYKLAAETGGVSIEAWAVVHNDSPDDWEEVALSLISGAPASYVMSVASPRYRHRETLSLDVSGDAMTPQLGADTPDSLLYPTRLMTNEATASYGFGGLGLGGGVGGGSGYGYGASGKLARVQTDEVSSSLLSVGAPAAEVRATAEVEGEMSVYTALDPVTVHAGASALVPVLRQKLPGETFVQVSGDGNGKTCVRAVNDTGLVLQAGPASVTARGRFRGQTPVERTAPGDIRVWCFGEDVDVYGTVREETAWKHRVLEWKDNRLYAHGIKTTEARYRIENEAGASRRVAVAIARQENGRFLTSDEMVPGEGDTYLLMVDVPEQGALEKTVVKEEAVARTIFWTVDAFEELLEEAALDTVQRAVVARALEKSRESLGVDEQIGACKTGLSKLRDKVSRLKSNLGSVPRLEGASDTVDRILREIMDAEARMVAETERLEDLEADKRALLDAVSGILSELSGEESTG